MSTHENPTPWPRSATAPPPVRALRVVTQREKSLNTAKVWALLLILIGLANAAGGIIAGVHITRPAYDFLGDPSGTEISPTGWAFIINAVVVGLILVLAGAIVISFANALEPEPEKS